jgi:protein-tyrosine-phosphatase
MAELPGAVLFVCNYNAVRSPMAEGLLKQLLGGQVFVDSVGVRQADRPDPFMVAVMDELGIDLSRHKPKSFDDLEDEAESYDLVITLSPQAQHRALELTRYAAIDVEFWMTFDPTVTEGSRDVVLQAYREVRDHLRRRIHERFPVRPMSAV